MSEKHWPTEFERTTSPDWTVKYPRPTADTAHPSHLESRQQQWDTAEEKRKDLAKRTDAIRAQREADEQAKRDQAEAARQARDQKKLAALTAELKRAYLASPGATEADFEKALPELLETRRREAALRGENQARAAQAAMYRSF